MSQSRHKGSQAKATGLLAPNTSFSPGVLTQMSKVVSQVDNTVQSSTGSQVSVQVLSNSGTVSSVAPTF